MAIYHLHVSICSGKKGQSAVASCAYQSGEKLYSELDRETKRYTSKQRIERILVKGGVILPKNAPREFENREKLWNSVQAVEGVNGQYARKWDIAIPRELDAYQAILLVERFCQKEFAERGMCADWSIHDDGKGNPHVHIMTTTRPFLENGQWGKKSRSITVKKNGKAVCVGRDKNGRKRYKHKCEKMTNWDKIETLQAIRSGWANAANYALERAHCKERITEKSYEALGVDKVPTIHEGYAAQKLERKEPGSSERVAKNKEIREVNAKYDELMNEREAVSAEITEPKEQRKPWLINENLQVAYEEPPKNIAYQGIVIVKKWQEYVSKKFWSSWEKAVDSKKIYDAMMQFVKDDAELSVTYLQPIQNIDNEAQKAKKVHEIAMKNADAEIAMKKQSLDRAQKAVVSAVSSYNAAVAVCNAFDDSSLIYRIKHIHEYNEADEALPELQKAMKKSKQKRTEARSAVEKAESAKKMLIEIYNKECKQRSERRESAVERLKSKTGKLAYAEVLNAVPALSELDSIDTRLQNALRQAENIQREKDEQTILDALKAYAENPALSSGTFYDALNHVITKVQQNSPLASSDTLYAHNLAIELNKKVDDNGIGVVDRIHQHANINHASVHHSKKL